MPKAVFVRPDFDLVTNYLSAYVTKLEDYARGNNYEIVDLYNDSQLPARNTTFLTEMEKKPIDVLIGGGHGNVDRFTGQDLEILIQTAVNPDVCTDTKTLLWSCLTAQQLGPKLVEKGCPEYYGYREDWTFIYNPDYESRPLEDPYARAFFDSGLATGYALLLGKSPQEIFQTTLDRYTYWYDYWQKSEDEMADDILTWLNWNRTNFTAIVPGERYETAQSALSLPAIILPLAGAGLLLLLLSRA